MKYLDKIANIALILGVAVFLFIVIRGEFRSREQLKPSAQALVGTSVTLPGVVLSQSHMSLVIALSTKCHFCQDSLPFYKELTAKAQGKLDIIAVLPQPKSEAQSFLQSAGVSATKIVSANLTTIGVWGTPTLLLLDEHGKVQKEWVGILDESGRQQVLAKIL
jgi:hypothetical protein